MPDRTMWFHPKCEEFMEKKYQEYVWYIYCTRMFGISGCSCSNKNVSVGGHVLNTIVFTFIINGRENSEYTTIYVIIRWKTSWGCCQNAVHVRDSLFIDKLWKKHSKYSTRWRVENIPISLSGMFNRRMTYHLV